MVLIHLWILYTGMIAKNGELMTKFNVEKLESDLMAAIQKNTTKDILYFQALRFNALIEDIDYHLRKIKDLDKKD